MPRSIGGKQPRHRRSTAEAAAAAFATTSTASSTATSPSGPKSQKHIASARRATKAAVLSTASAHVTASKRQSKACNQRTYTFDLGRPASERWVQILDDFRQPLLQLITRLRATLPLMPPAWMRHTVSRLIQLRRHSLYVFDEIEAIAALLDLPVFDVLLAQLGYELMMACTTVVTPHGTHFRTLDWPIPEMAQLMVQLNVVDSSGRLICRALTLPGYCGFLTGMVPQQWSGAINHRENTANTFQAALRYVTGQYWPVAYALRHALTRCNTYSEARVFLLDVALVSPCYITLCGTEGEGCLLIRSPRSTIETQDVNVATNASVVITNHDDEEDKARVEGEDVGLDDSVARANAASIAARQCTQSNWDALTTAFRRNPIYTPETVMSCIMRPVDDFFQWRIRGQPHLR